MKPIILRPLPTLVKQTCHLSDNFVTIGSTLPLPMFLPNPQSPIPNPYKTKNPEKHCASLGLLYIKSIKQRRLMYAGGELFLFVNLITALVF